MAASPIRQKFIQNTRNLAEILIYVSDRANNLGAELALTPYFLSEEEGGFSREDFENSPEISAADIMAFYGAVQTILGSLDDAKKRSIYTVRSGINTSGPVGGSLF